MRRYQELTVAIGWRREPRLVDKKTTWPVCKLHEESPVDLQVSPHRAGWFGCCQWIDFCRSTENLPALPPDHHLFHRGFDGQGRVVQLQGILRRQ